MITEVRDSRIRAPRRQRRLPQKKPAPRVEINRIYPSGIESGRRGGTVKSMGKNARAPEIFRKRVWNFDPHR